MPEMDSASDMSKNDGVKNDISHVRIGSFENKLYFSYILYPLV